MTSLKIWAVYLKNVWPFLGFATPRFHESAKTPYSVILLPNFWQILGSDLLIILKPAFTYKAGSRNRRLMPALEILEMETHKPHYNVVL